MSEPRSITGNIVDLHNKEIFPGEITIVDHKILHIKKVEGPFDHYILPGFIDAHIHIESSMLVPYEFARVALAHGTVATISDPHEIANVLGVDGVKYMIENARDAKLKFHFGAPSCVPATNFETAGAVIDSEDVKKLLASDDIFYLSEMMNYPGVLFGDPEVFQKIEAAKKIGKPIDGHAPGLMGSDAKKYITAGISTDHECFTLEEALDKLSHGMKIIIREGSAAKNFDALHSLIESHPEQVMFCSDDKHPDDLIEGHINQLVTRSLKLGYDLFSVLKIACLQPVDHYKMKVGCLRLGDPADFIVVNNLEQFQVQKTFIDGQCVFENGTVQLEKRTYKCPNNFHIGKLKKDDFMIESTSKEVTVINAINGELITEKSIESMDLVDGALVTNEEEDILKISVINRYYEAPVASAFIKGFGIKNGAIASTVAHDSHNVVVVGSNDELMCRAANLLVENKGGLAAVGLEMEEVIALPIAGLMSDQPCRIIAKEYASIDRQSKSLGSRLTSPFMTLSFMALLVIPKIKMSDKGLFDAEKFEFIS